MENIRRHHGRGVVLHFAAALVLVLITALGILLQPARTSAWTLGQDFSLGAYASPAWGGTVDVPPPDDPDLGLWSYIHSYTLTAQPAAGWVVSGWAGCPASWVNGSTVIVNPDKDAEAKAFMLNAQGSVTIYAYFSRASIPINCLAVTGVVWANGGGNKGVAIGEALNISVSLTTAKAVDWEFAGWAGSHNVIHAIDDYMNDQGAPGTYRASPCYITPEYDWDNEQYSWVKPMLREKDQASENCTTTWNGGEGGHFKYENPQELPVGTSMTQEWESDNAMVVFDHWDLVNLGCANIDAYFTQFWALSSDNATATCVTSEANFTTYYDITIEQIGQGSTIPITGTHTYLKGSGIVLLAIPKAGWQLARWEGLNDGQQSTALQVDQIVKTDGAVYRAVFTRNHTGPGGDPGDEDPAGTTTGLFGRINDTLDGVGLGNDMGRMLVVLVCMVGAWAALRKSKALSVIIPLGILGVGIIAAWVPIWIVALLALTLGLLMFRGLSKTTEGG